MDSRVVSSADATPPGFRWLGLKRIHVRRVVGLLHPSTSPQIRCRAVDPPAATARLPPPLPPPPPRCLLPASLVLPYLPPALLTSMQWEDPHGRARVWESAERSTRRGAVDGVAIVAKVGLGGGPPTEEGACTHPGAALSLIHAHPSELLPMAAST